jgi:prevent-host-death family protein
MHTLPLSEFRANASAMLDLVEQGETVRIMRHGKPVADLVPVRDEQPLRQPSWKQPFDPVQLPPMPRCRRRCWTSATRPHGDRTRRRPA